MSEVTPWAYQQVCKANEKKRAEIERLTAERAVLVSVIKQSREKLEIYRDHSDGQYHGGIEHTALIRNINQALSE